jgi:hypothetical protein
VALASLSFAEDAAAGPKIGAEFAQQFDTESVNWGVAQASGGKTFGTDALYSKTELKGSAAYDLGNGITLTPAIKDGLEAFYSAGNINLLSAVRYRNRFNPTVTLQVKIVPEFNLGIAADFRLANDISTSAASAMSVSKPLESRVGGTVTGSGKVAIVNYSLAQSAFYYMDVLPSNSKDEAFLELDGTYAIGTGFALNDALTLKLDLSDRLIYDFLSVADAANTANSAPLTNYGTLKVSLANPGFTPYVALLATNCLNNKGGNQVNFLGGALGGDFTKGNYTVGGKYEIGTNNNRESAKGVSAGSDQIESHLSVYFKIKA